MPRQGVGDLPPVTSDPVTRPRRSDDDSADHRGPGRGGRPEPGGAPDVAAGHGPLAGTLPPPALPAPPAGRFRRKLVWFRDVLAQRHGLLARDRTTGALGYGFIHGNWALCNSRPDGRWCGVNNELEILRATGCYADFTMPSAPHPTQIGK